MKVPKFIGEGRIKFIHHLLNMQFMNFECVETRGEEHVETSSFLEKNNTK